MAQSEVVSSLLSDLRSLREKAVSLQGRGLNEETTKAALIIPLLARFHKDSLVADLQLDLVGFDGRLERITHPLGLDHPPPRNLTSVLNWEGGVSWIAAVGSRSAHMRGRADLLET
jgi:hypothetical protein